MSLARHHPLDPGDTLGSRDFERIAAFVRQTTGIKMPSNKSTMLESRLRRRLRATGHMTLADYCAWLFTDQNLAEESGHLINAVTTNKTDFFREPRHFDVLQGLVLPGLQQARRVRAWSAACSTGAEPYTMAMVMDAFTTDRGGPDYTILATDLDTDVLSIGKRGVFPAEMIEPVPRLLRSRYVMTPRAGPGRSEVRMVPELRAMINFAQHNLMDERYLVGEPMDIIFCRNVLIYFDRPTQEQVVRRLLACLKVGGHLFLGHSESIAGMDLPLTAVANTVFRKERA